MVRMINHFILTGVLIALFFLSGCATSANTVKVDDATATKLRSEVTVYNSTKISGLEYKTVRQIHVTACGSRENAMDQLRSLAHEAGANGITKINCGTLLGPTLMQNCLTTVMCEAVAITVGTKKVEAEKVETEKVAAEKIDMFGKKQVLSEGEGFTLGKLPLVVTSYDAVGKAKDVEIIFSGNYMTKGIIVKRDEENNLAIISFEEFRRVPAGFRVFPSYKVKAGQNVYVLGYGPKTQSGNNPIIAEGIISAADGPEGDSRYFRLTAHSNLFNGGSPLLDVQGRVIGIVLPASSKASSPHAKRPLPEGTYFALKSTVLLNLYPEIEDLVASENEPPLTPREISATYGNSVVTVIAK
jgi:S1-C subfamily serine protease